MSKSFGVFRFHRCASLLVLVSVAILNVLLTSAAVRAQGLATFSLPLSSPNPSSLVRQAGAYSTAPIRLDGIVLFRVAAPTAPGPDQIPVEQRASYVESVLAQITAAAAGTRTATNYDPASIVVRVKRVGSEALLEVIDARHREPLPVVTVTASDAHYHQRGIESLATHWQLRLQGALRKALAERQPAEVHQNVSDVVRVGVALVVASVLAFAGIMRIRRRIDGLEQRLVSHEADLAELEDCADPALDRSTHKRRRRFLAVALQGINPLQRLTFYRALVGAIVWLLVLGWFLVATWALALFPQTTALALRLSRTGDRVAEIWIATGLLNRVLDVVITRMGSLWRITRSGATSEERARQLLRIPTVARALAGFKSFILIFLALLATLGAIGIPIGSVVTIGGITAIGVSLAAQNFVRDFVNGFLVLFEDQYVVGDYITINGHSGLVEHLNLRMVQLRDGSGNLITIPHSTVSSVVNQSRNWSRVDYRVPIDPNANVAHAVELVRASIEHVALREAWRDGVKPVEWIGVDTLSRDCVVIRASAKTAPLRQFDLRRQINARVCEAFTEAGIGFGAPIAEPAG